MGEERRAELAGRLAAVRERLAAACAAAGRDPDQVELMAVTKTVPAADVATLLDLGLTLFGENRVQEAGRQGRRGRRPAARAPTGPRWHFIGGLQRNKARAVVGWAHRVESVDSVRLADALDRRHRPGLRRRAPPRPAAGAAAVQRRRRPDPRRGPGRRPPPLADHVAARPALRLDGLMAVAPLNADPEAAFADVESAAADGCVPPIRRRPFSRPV